MPWPDEGFLKGLAAANMGAEVRGTGRAIHYLSVLCAEIECSLSDEQAVHINPW